MRFLLPHRRVRGRPGGLPPLTATAPGRAPNGCLTRYEVGIASSFGDRDDLAMKPLLVAVLWVLAGSYFGGLVERVTGLGMTLPVLAVFAICGVYLAVRISRTPLSAAAIGILPAVEQDERLAA